MCTDCIWSSEPQASCNEKGVQYDCMRLKFFQVCGRGRICLWAVPWCVIYKRDRTWVAFIVCKSRLILFRINSPIKPAPKSLLYDANTNTFSIITSVITSLVWYFFRHWTTRKAIGCNLIFENVMNFSWKHIYDCFCRPRKKVAIMATLIQSLWLLKWYEFIPSFGITIHVWGWNSLVALRKVNGFQLYRYHL